MMIMENIIREGRQLTDQEKWLSTKLMSIAFDMHRSLGPGLLQAVYERIFCYELEQRNIPYLKQKRVEIFYRGLRLDEGLRLGLLVDNTIIIELKAEAGHQPLWEAQLLSFMKLSGKRLGYVLNFHTPLMKDGVKRILL